MQGLEIPGKPRPWVMAHRGASDLAPENSLASFGLALDHGADLIETDLWFTADGALVCHHDATLDRMLGVARPISDVTKSELRNHRLCSRFEAYHDERVPLLEELLELATDTPVMLELKDPKFAEGRWARRLADALGDRAGRQKAGIICERLAWLQPTKDHAPELITGHITLRNPLPTQWTEVVGPYWPLLWLNPWYVRQAHRRGKRVCPLDPRIHDHLGRYLELDVDAVLTNDPGETRRRIAALR